MHTSYPLFANTGRRMSNSCFALVISPFHKDYGATVFMSIHFSNRLLLVAGHCNNKETRVNVMLPRIFSFLKRRPLFCFLCYGYLFKFASPSTLSLLFSHLYFFFSYTSSISTSQFYAISPSRPYSTTAFFIFTATRRSPSVTCPY
jgi:hypothetical protein